MTLSQGSNGSEVEVEVLPGELVDTEITDIAVQDPATDINSECSTTQDVESDGTDTPGEPNQFEEVNQVVQSTLAGAGAGTSERELISLSRARELVSAANGNDLGVRMLKKVGLDEQQILLLADTLPDNEKVGRINDIYSKVLADINKKYKLADTNSFTAMGSEWNRKCNAEVRDIFKNSYCPMENFFETKVFYESLLTVLNSPGISEQVNKKTSGYISVKKAAEQNTVGQSVPALFRQVGKI